MNRKSDKEIDDSERIQKRGYNMKTVNMRSIIRGILV
jgi:hypothetical protein